MSSEASRVRSVKRFLSLQHDLEGDLQSLLELASRISHAPLALVTLLDQDTQWSCARLGTDVERLPRETAFCNITVQNQELTLVPDLTQDSRYAGNPYVTGEAGMRFYLGIPLVDAARHCLGTLCLIDMVPRTVTDEQLELLQGIAKQIMRLMELRLSLALLAKRNQRIEKQQEQILAQSSALQEIAFIQSHEVRSPVASILGLVNLIQLGGTTAAAEYLPLLEEAALQLDHTIRKTVGQTYSPAEPVWGVVPAVA